MEDLSILYSLNRKCSSCFQFWNSCNYIFCEGIQMSCASSSLIFSEMVIIQRVILCRDASFSSTFIKRRKKNMFITSCLASDCYQNNLLYLQTVLILVDQVFLPFRKILLISYCFSSSLTDSRIFITTANSLNPFQTFCNYRGRQLCCLFLFLSCTFALSISGSYRLRENISSFTREPRIGRAF